MVQGREAAELLQQLRAAAPEMRRRYRDRLDRIIANQADEPYIGEGPTTAMGRGRVRAQLLGYHEVLVFEETGAVQGLAANVPEAIFQLNEIFTFTLRFDVARHLLEKYIARWPGARPLNILPPIIGEVDGPCDAFRDQKKLDVQIASATGSTTTIVVFCGMRHAFGVQLNVLHHCCLAKHDVNVIYLRDFSENLYLSGVAGLGDVPRTCSYLRSVLSELQTHKTVFMGNSGGVFGSLYLGALMKADMILAFSGPTSLEIGLEETERQAYPRLLQLRKEGKIKWPELKSLYAESDLQADIYFGARNRVDTAQAENLSGLPRVRLFPVPTASHFVLDELARSRKLDGIFAAAAHQN